ncbi:MAG: hypothetical protein HYV97_07640 [Bdellovibrio sp.]|nr:hypothetical protein [Bdellovibrio sp.]
MSVQKIIRKSFIIFCGIFQFIGLAEAKMILVPAKIDFNKTMAGFVYSHTERSVNGKKIGLSARLMPNGYLYVSGIYIGETFDACSGRGGNAAVVLDVAQRENLMKMALQSYNENQQLSSKEERGAYETGPQLSVELGQDMGNTTLNNIGTQTDLFQKELATLMQKVFDDGRSRTHGLEISLALKKNHLQFTLTNIGKNPAVIMLPEDASTHFFYRKTEDELVGLQYAVRPTKRVIKLQPKKNFRVMLIKPTTGNLDKIVFVYDNMADVYHDDPAMVSSPKVQICAGLK